MKIGYKNIFPWGEETYFKEKIKLSKEMNLSPVLKAKIHTMREDPKDRWPPLTGLIHHTYFNRTPEEDCFLITPCTGIQKIEINYKSDEKAIHIFIDKKFYTRYPKPGYENQVSMPYEYLVSMRKLAWNDGFDTPEQFFKWFNTDWSGKIIHWTNKRY